MSNEDFLEKEIVKGEALTIGDRIIYPIIQVSNLECQDKFWFEYITPIALAIKEAGNKYLIPLVDEDSEEYKSIKLEDILD